jgi:hypothetical protein
VTPVTTPLIADRSGMHRGENANAGTLEISRTRQGRFRAHQPDKVTFE